MYAKSSSGQRRRIDLGDLNNETGTETFTFNPTKLPNPVNISSPVDKIIIKNKKMNELKNKYLNKIVNTIIKAIYENKNNVAFYYNYYDLLNDRIGKPHGLLNEFLYEMSYEYSSYINNDQNGNPMTLRTLFGNNFRWELKGKNRVIFYW